MPKDSYTVPPYKKPTGPSDAYSPWKDAPINEAAVQAVEAELARRKNPGSSPSRASLIEKRSAGGTRIHQKHGWIKGR